MDWVVYSAHISNYPHPIQFQVGECVEIEKTDDEYPGWIWVTTADGNQGWAPIQYLQMDDSGNQATVKQDYSARELNTTIGERLTLHYELKGWGWVENAEHDCGWVPMKSIQRLDEE